MLSLKRNMLSQANKREKADHTTRFYANYSKHRLRVWPNIGAMCKVPVAHRLHRKIFVRLFAFYRLYDNMWIDAHRHTTDSKFLRFKAQHSLA